MRHVAHFCVTFLVRNDGKAPPMRHRFGPKRRRNRRDRQKPLFYSCLREARQCTEVTHGVRSQLGEETDPGLSARATYASFICYRARKPGSMLRFAVLRHMPKPSLPKETPFFGDATHARRRSISLETNTANASLTTSSHAAAPSHGGQSAAALMSGWAVLFHRPRSCQAKVDETLTSAIAITVGRSAPAKTEPAKTFW
jgi:hypothetical protein